MPRIRTKRRRFVPANRLGVVAAAVGPGLEVAARLLDVHLGRSEMNAPLRHLKRAGPVASAIAALVLVLVPSASSQGGPQYPGPAGYSGSAPDITGITVASDTGSGQIVFRIA